MIAKYRPAVFFFQQLDDLFQFIPVPGDITGTKDCVNSCLFKYRKGFSDRCSCGMYITDQANRCHCNTVVSLQVAMRRRIQSIAGIIGPAITRNFNTTDTSYALAFQGGNLVTPGFKLEVTYQTDNPFMMQCAMYFLNGSQDLGKFAFYVSA